MASKKSKPEDLSDEELETVRGGIGGRLGGKQFNAGNVLATGNQTPGQDGVWMNDWINNAKTDTTSQD